jgi:tRNA A37 N6-isopentenylltransferase MiaA
MNWAMKNSILCLKDLDPKAALKLHPANSQRIVRAYEVFLYTRKSIYDFHEKSSALST